MKSSKTLVLSAFVLLLAQRVANAVGPAACSRSRNLINDRT